MFVVVVVVAGVARGLVALYDDEVTYRRRTKQPGEKDFQRLRCLYSGFFR